MSNTKTIVANTTQTMSSHTSRETVKILLIDLQQDDETKERNDLVHPTCDDLVHQAWFRSSLASFLGPAKAYSMFTTVSKEWSTVVRTSPSLCTDSVWMRAACPASLRRIRKHHPHVGIILDPQCCHGLTTEEVNALFACLRGIHTLDMRNCNQAGITDAAFVHLRGIHTLYMSGCKQPGITDAAFVHLRGIHTLNMSHCDQPEITDAAFVHLRGIHTLDMSYCNQAGITDAAFAHLRGIHTLHMSCCWQADITDAAFAHLRGIHTLNISWCQQVTDAAFVHLAGIHTLDMSRCNQITDVAFVHLVGIHTLDMSLCNQITDAAFVHLVGIHTLDMSCCNQAGITDAAFVHLSGIHDKNVEEEESIHHACDLKETRDIVVPELVYCKIAFCNLFLL